MHDRTLAREGLARLLNEEGGVDTVGAADVAAAAELRFGPRPPDLLLVKGGLLRADGARAIAALRARERTEGLLPVPIIVESASSSLLASGLRAGADAACRMSGSERLLSAVALLLYGRSVPGPESPRAGVGVMSSPAPQSAAVAVAGVGSGS